MSFFGDISHYTNTQDYLSIISAALGVDLMVIFLLEKKIIRSTFLKKWYTLCGISAILADIMIITLVIVVGRFIYSYLFSYYSIALFLLIVIAVQLVHDTLFYWFFSAVPRGFNVVLDIFKDYAKECGYSILLADAVVLVCTILYGSYLATLSLNMNILHFLMILYFIPYTLYAL